MTFLEIKLEREMSDANFVNKQKYIMYRKAVHKQWLFLGGGIWVLKLCAFDLLTLSIF